MAPSQINLDHYDEAYYLSHYAHLSHSRQRLLWSEFYAKAVFNRHLPGVERVLDFGAGHGALSLSVNADCFDGSIAATKSLAKSGRRTHHSIDDIPEGYYDAIFSSHTLEHVTNPVDILNRWRTWLRDDGRVLLILPIESNPGPVVKSADDNLHLFGWNFQQLFNILNYCGFDTVHQEVFNGPFMLSTFGKFLSAQQAAKLAITAGRLKRSYPQILTVAKLNRGSAIP